MLLQLSTQRGKRQVVETRMGGHSAHVSQIDPSAFASGPQLVGIAYRKTGRNDSTGISAILYAGPIVSGPISSGPWPCSVSAISLVSVGKCVRLGTPNEDALLTNSAPMELSLDSTEVARLGAFELLRDCDGSELLWALADFLALAILCSSMK
eukprot:2699852-Rhodomonas_salina.1